MENIMKRNVGTFDRLLRIVIGLGFLYLAFFTPQGSTWDLFGQHTTWGYFGLVPLFTGIFSWCPPYALLGISTRPRV